MKNKRLLAAFLILILTVSLACYVCAEKNAEKWRNQSDHTRWTNAMIFGNESYSYAKPIEIRNNVTWLDDALLLCIDQYNGSYEDKLKKLNDANIPGIPANISAIDFRAGTDHRVYTHRGWYHTYNETEIEKGHADVRRQILRSVVNYVFNFNNYLSEDIAKKKCDAMCCLLYVTHIIGDRYHSAKYYGSSSTLVLAEETESVIHDLEQCLPTLLSKSDSSMLILKLKNISNELIRERRNNDSIDNRLALDKKYAPEIKKLLKESLYNLLSEQEWFSAVFDSKWASF